MRGFTETYIADCGDHTLTIKVQAGTDLDSCFTAWDVDSCEAIRINGWLWAFEAI